MKCTIPRQIRGCLKGAKREFTAERSYLEVMCALVITASQYSANDIELDCL
jgi:uncharacterized protein (UPF0147 family)